MNDLDPSWCLYARLQIQSRRRSRTDATGWGIEAALDHLLDLRANDNSSDHEREAIRAVERGKARERHQTRLRAYYCDPRLVNDPTQMLDDRARFREALAGVDRTARVILLATGFGHSSATISSCLSVEPAAVRKRINRLRAKLAS